MLISIITPTFNSELTISENIESIITQSYINFEHIIIDNVSNDKTLNIAKKIYKDVGLENKLKIVSEKDRGIADAFNKGIGVANGEIITILNSDDKYSDENVFNNVIKSFKNEEILFTHGDIYYEDPVYGSNIRKPLLCPITLSMPFNHPTMFFRRSIYDMYGTFDLSYLYAMDFEFICRLEKRIENFIERGKYINVKPIVIHKSGGASWRYELEGLEEVKRALKQYGYWNFEAKKSYLLRMLRIKLKGYLNRLKLNEVVKFWRKRKWAS